MIKASIPSLRHCFFLNDIFSNLHKWNAEFHCWVSRFVVMGISVNQMIWLRSPGSRLFWIPNSSYTVRVSALKVHLKEPTGFREHHACVVSTANEDLFLVSVFTMLVVLVIKDFVPHLQQRENISLMLNSPCCSRDPWPALHVLLWWSGNSLGWRSSCQSSHSYQKKRGVGQHYISDLSETYQIQVFIFVCLLN